MIPNYQLLLVIAQLLRTLLKLCLKEAFFPDLFAKPQHFFLFQACAFFTFPHSENRVRGRSHGHNKTMTRHLPLLLGGLNKQVTNIILVALGILLLPQVPHVACPTCWTFCTISPSFSFIHPSVLVFLIITLRLLTQPANKVGHVGSKKGRARIVKWDVFHVFFANGTSKLGRVETWKGKFCTLNIKSVVDAA